MELSFFAGNGLTEIDAGKEYIFKPLPEGYKLYEHVKGKKVGTVQFFPPHKRLIGDTG